MPNDTDLEWFHNEPEELARLAHYVIYAGIYPSAHRKGWTGFVFPVLTQSRARNVYLLCPDPSRVKGMVGLGNRTATFRTLGLEGDYHSWLVSPTYLTKVCDES